MQLSSLLALFVGIIGTVAAGTYFAFAQSASFTLLGAKLAIQPLSIIHGASSILMALVVMELRAASSILTDLVVMEVHAASSLILAVACQ